MQQRQQSPVQYRDQNRCVDDHQCGMGQQSGDQRSEAEVQHETHRKNAAERDEPRPPRTGTKRRSHSVENPARQLG